MNFDATTYELNLQVLEKTNPAITTKLDAIKENSRFNINEINNEFVIIDTKNNTPLELPSYSNAQLEKFKAFASYSHIFLFGIGNGVYLKYLLENSNAYILLFEPEIELLFIAFHTMDFRQYLVSNLKILVPKDSTGSDFIRVLVATKAKFSTFSYQLMLSDPYYHQAHKKEYDKTNETIVNKLNFIILNDGTDINDSLTGLTNHINNLKYMLQNPNFADNIKNKAKTDVAVVVSTGPSLSKQLPLLKQYQDYVTILSADSALTVLEQNGIQPDFCCSMERDEPIKLLFEKVPENFKKDVIFVRASLQMDFIKDFVKPGADMLVMRPFPYNRAFKLDKYGYICSGMSVANMNHELGINLGCKYVVFIGQDLAYSDDGRTHAKGHIHGEKAKYALESGFADVHVTAYGGKGKVLTNEGYVLFKNGIEQIIELTKLFTQTINSTEGGVRIEGSIEMPFAKVLEKYVKKTKKKEKYQVKSPSQEEIKQNLTQTEETLKHLIKDGKNLQKLLENAVKKIGKDIDKVKDKNQKEMLKYFSDKRISKSLDYISKTRASLDNEVFRSFYINFCQQAVVHTEMKLQAIRAQIPKNPEENKQKAILWISHHFNYFFEMAGFINASIEILKKADLKV